MTQPKLSLASSGLGGRGYRSPFEEGAPVVPSVTTALGALEKPGIVRWHVTQTAARCISIADKLAEMNEESALRFMQYYSSRLTEKKVDELAVYDYSDGVLSDLAEVGDFIHNWVEDDLNGGFPEDPWREDQEQMVNAYLDWKADNDIELICTERTVFGSTATGGYAGTLDGILKINGVTTFEDVKTSRTVYESHVAQLAALSSAHTMAVEVPEGTEGAYYHKISPKVSESHGGQVDSWWKPEGIPGFEQFGILRIRPDDYDQYGRLTPAFCRLEVIPHQQVESAFGLFEAGLAARHAQRNYNQVLKKLEKEAA